MLVFLQSLFEGLDLLVEKFDIIGWNFWAAPKLLILYHIKSQFSSLFYFISRKTKWRISLRGKSSHVESGMKMGLLLLQKRICCSLFFVPWTLAKLFLFFINCGGHNAILLFPTKKNLASFFMQAEKLTTTLTHAIKDSQILYSLLGQNPK